MDNLQNQSDAWVAAFVAENAELARAPAYQALRSGLDQGQFVSADLPVKKLLADGKLRVEGQRSVPRSNSL